MKSIFLDTNHLMLRAPDGGVEDVASMKQAGFGSIFCNIGDYHPDSWQTVRNAARDVGMVCGPWLRTFDEVLGFSMLKLEFLSQVADEWHSPFIVNSESELNGSGATLTKRIAEKIGSRDAAISMEAWPFASVEWWPLAGYPMLPQIFPQESDAAKHPQDCKEAWHNYGIECVVLTFGSYGGISPLTYDRLSPYGIYTADDCRGDFKTWGPLGRGTPCRGSLPQPPGVDMPEIGSQHGITAFMTWLRKQPGVPVRRAPNYNPKDPQTWPWPERYERTLRMLVEDHDARQP